MEVTPSDTFPANNCLSPGITSGGYFQKVGNTSVGDVLIGPGDEFMFYADNNQAINAAAGNPTGELLWHATNWAGWGYAPIGDKYTYKIIDTTSHGTISSGEFILH